MLRILNFLLTGDWHLHKWETIDKRECSGDSGRWMRYYCKCSICGKHKKFD